MADEPKTDQAGKGKAAAAKAPADPPAADTAQQSAGPSTADESAPVGERYDVAGWQERARSRFDCSPHTVAGALHDAPAGQTFSEAEVSAKVEAFNSREIEPGVTQ